jgi:hypothetical protein
MSVKNKNKNEKTLVEYEEGEIWKQWENTGLYFSSHGKEATKNTNNGRLYLKERKPRNNGNIDLISPLTRKRVGLHTIIAMLFLIPSVLWKHIDNTLHGDCISVIRKINKDTSNSACDLICINRSAVVTYSYKTHNVEHFNLNETQLAARLSWSVHWVRNTTTEEFVLMGVTRNGSNIIPTSFNWGDGCFQIPKEIAQEVETPWEVETVETTRTARQHCAVVSKCFKRQREYQHQKEIWDSVRELYKGVRTDFKAIREKRRHIQEQKEDNDGEQDKVEDGAVGL